MSPSPCARCYEADCGGDCGYPVRVDPTEARDCDGYPALAGLEAIVRERGCRTCRNVKNAANGARAFCPNCPGASVIPADHCPVCTKELAPDGWCFKCRHLRGAR